jgi:membrane protein DedA with SNARE-associated domain
MLEHLSSLIIQFIQATGYLGIFVLMTLESALIPIPSEITMPFSGFLVNQGTLSFVPVVLVGALGNVVGSVIAYYIGYFLEETVVLIWVKKYGKFLLISEHEYHQSVKWLNKYGESVSFFSRLLPGIRTFISLPVGLGEMNLKRFITYTFLGSLLWSAVLTYIGVYFGKNWHALEPYYRKFELLIGGVLVLGVLWYINHKLKIVKFK